MKAKRKFNEAGYIEAEAAGIAFGIALIGVAVLGYLGYRLWH